MNSKTTIQILQALCNYIESNRQVGHTTALIRGAQNVDNVLVLAGNQHLAAHIQNLLPRAEVSAITSPTSIVGKTKPMVMDLSAIREIAKASLAEIERLHNRIEELEAQTNSSLK